MDPTTHTRFAAPGRPSDHPWPDAESGFSHRGVWPADWIATPGATNENYAAVYKTEVDIDDAVSVRVLVSADERYDLFLDGIRIGRGPERGDPSNWFFQAFDVCLTPGRHRLAARVWSQGLFRAPWSHLGLHHGFILAAQDPAWTERLSTGRAVWKGKPLAGLRFEMVRAAAWHSQENIDGESYPWEAIAGTGEGWLPVQVLRPGRTARASSFIHSFEHALRPGLLPPLSRGVCRPGRVVAVDRPSKSDSSDIPMAAGEPSAMNVWQDLWKNGVPATIPAGTRVRVLIDLEGYWNAYVHWDAAGAGGRVIIDLSERLSERAETKPSPSASPRFLWAGRYWPSGGASWKLDGMRRADGLWWWRSGRFLKVEFEAGNQGMTVYGLALEETRFPLEDDIGCASDDSGLNLLLGQCVRTVQCCMHETFMDCPWHEQQFWVGDARIQMLLSHHLSADVRLVRRCLTYIADTRLPYGPTRGRYPAPQQLCIPSFTLAFCGMVHDYAAYRGNRGSVASLMPAVRSVIDWFLSHRRSDGLVDTPRGWNFIDWVPHWKDGEPPGSIDAPSAIVMWWLAGSAAAAADIEDWLGEEEMSMRYARLASEIAEAADKAFWNEARGLYADDPSHANWSEHAQIMAALFPSLAPERRIRLAQTLPAAAGSIAATNLYFDYYHHEALALLNRRDCLWRRWDRYRGFSALDLFTTPESAGLTRSDCHAWSAHPRLHAVRIVAGLAPLGIGATMIALNPHLGPLNHIETGLPLPSGDVRCRIVRAGGSYDIQLQTPVPCRLPDGHVLPMGSHRINLPA